MSIRSFRGSDGVDWQVWCVTPPTKSGKERRLLADRRSPDPVLRYAGAERRTGEDRRGQGMRWLNDRFAHGWLVFESAREKRRLSPVPEGWDAVPPDELERLCNRAQPTVIRATP